MEHREKTLLPLRIHTPYFQRAWQGSNEGYQ